MTGRRQRIRLIVGSPDGTRVLARPNGLAGWCLPAIAVDGPFTAWTPAATEAARSVLSASVVALGPVADDCWAVRPDGRVPAPGNEWIDVARADRLGVDAVVVRRWSEAGPYPGDDDADGPGSSDPRSTPGR